MSAKTSFFGGGFSFIWWIIIIALFIFLFFGIFGGFGGGYGYY